LQHISGEPSWVNEGCASDTEMKCPERWALAMPCLSTRDRWPQRVYEVFTGVPEAKVFIGLPV